MRRAVAYLQNRGAHFVLCDGKRPVWKRWQKRRPPVAVVTADPGNVGIMPASIDTSALDVDRGNTFENRPGSAGDRLLNKDPHVARPASFQRGLPGMASAPGAAPDSLQEGQSLLVPRGDSLRIPYRRRSASVKTAHALRAQRSLAGVTQRPAQGVPRGAGDRRIAAHRAAGPARLWTITVSPTTARARTGTTLVTIAASRGRRRW